MSVQTISGRHRARRFSRSWRRLRRAGRTTLRSGTRFVLLLRSMRPRTYTAPAGVAYTQELLTPSAVTTMVVGRARIGYYGPAATVAAPRIHDDVRVARNDRFPAHVGQTGTVVAISGTVLPVTVQLVGVGTIYCDAGELELLDRPTARTLVMDAIVDAMIGAPLSERAW